MYPSTSPPKPLHVNYIKPHRKTKLVSFIGKQCLVKCSIDAVTAETLWDDGAQATVNEAGRAEPGKLRSYREDKVHIVFQRETPDAPPPPPSMRSQLKMEKTARECFIVVFSYLWRK